MNPIPFLASRLGVALRTALGAEYGRRQLRDDIVAGIIVGIIALPLSMALAIATGVPPQYGLYTAIVAGTIIALLGGSSVQVSGPTAAFVVILAPIAAKFGLGGLLLATLMAGGFLILFGLLRMGKMIQFIPYTVTTGFTAGIAVVLVTIQIKDFLGLATTSLPDHFVERVVALFQAMPTVNTPDLFIGMLTLTLLFAWPRLSRTIPAALVGLGVAALVAAALHALWPGFTVATINSQFSYIIDGQVHAGIPRMPPMPSLPWLFGGPDGDPLAVTLDLLRDLAPSAFAIAMLGAIESLLSAVVADGMAGTTHDPDAELLAQGIGNVVVPFFGGFAATGAIARTAANVRSGARSPIAALSHAVFVLAAIVLFAPLLGYLPMAAMAALLMLVAWNMSEARHFIRVLRIAPRSDVLILLTCFLLTVVFDMVIAVSVGVVMSSLLFMRRMAEVSDAKLVPSTRLAGARSLPPGVLLYELAGPLFYGAAQKAMSHLQVVENSVHALVIDMQAAPAIDTTGLVSLESAIKRLHQQKIAVILTNVQEQPAHALGRTGWFDTPDEMLQIRESVQEAFEYLEAQRATRLLGAAE